MTLLKSRSDCARRSPTSLSRFLSMAIAILFCLISLVSFPSPSLADVSVAPSLMDSSVGSIADSEDIPADKVDQFAGAYLKVLQLLSDRESELPAAETSAEALKVQQSIESEAVALIKDSGLAMPEYMQILGLASQDITFRDKVLGRMDESMQE